MPPNDMLAEPERLFRVPGCSSQLRERALADEASNERNTALERIGLVPAGSGKHGGGVRRDGRESRSPRAPRRGRRGEVRKNRVGPMRFELTLPRT